jgi:hypothetical protein
MLFGVALTVPRVGVAAEPVSVPSVTRPGVGDAGVAFRVVTESFASFSDAGSNFAIRARPALWEHDNLAAWPVAFTLERLDWSGGSLSLGAAYEPFGFNLRPALAPGIHLRLATSALSVSLETAYAQSLVDTERSGAARLDALAPLGRNFELGLTSRADFDLELDADESPGEPQFEARGGPLVTWTRGPLRATASAGPLLLRLRFAEPRAGAGAQISIGTSL